MTLNITDSRQLLDIEGLLQDAEETLADKHRDEEESKRGDLRGGNSGIMTDDGRIFGNCHRIAYARYLGIEEPKEHGERTITQTRKFFQGGIANENTWFELLLAKWPAECILRESQIPTMWSIQNSKGEDVRITGRPDLVLRDPGTMSLMSGYELKCVSSAWRAGLIFKEQLPSSDYLCQAAHYSWQLAIPFTLSFSSYCSFYAIQPGRMHFYTGWKDDQLYVRHPLTGKIFSTVITPQGIKNFYGLIIAMSEEKELGPMFCEMKKNKKDEWVYVAPPSVYGDNKGEFPKCKSCPFRTACERFQDHDTWVDAVTEISKGGEI